MKSEELKMRNNFIRLFGKNTPLHPSSKGELERNTSFERRHLSTPSRKVITLAHKQVKATLILLTIVFTMSCDDFLKESPDNRTALDTPQKVSQILVNAYSGAQYTIFAEAMTDNVADKGPAASEQDEEINRRAYRWQDISLTTQDSPDYYWEKGYEAIAHANQALAAIKNLGDTAALSPLKGEALLARAYAHYMMLNIFSLRYDSATAATGLGIPYVTSPEKNAIRRYKRATIQQVYDSVERDMNEGLPLVRDNYKKPKFHFTPKAANAFAARFYLWKGGSQARWEKVVEHANKVLGDGVPSPSVIRDQNSAAHRALSFTQLKMTHSGSEQPANLLITWGYSLAGRKWYGGRYGLTVGNGGTERKLFNSGNPFGKSWGYRVFGGNDYYKNVPKMYEYFESTNPSAGTGNRYVAIIHLIVDEVLLNRAEAYAMLNQLDKSSADLTVFLSRKTRGFDASTDKITPTLMRQKYPRIANEYTPYYTLTDDQAAFVKGIAEFRRREFIHEAMRWFDIKRFNIVVNHPIVGGETLVLRKNDPRRAVQIPQYAQVYGMMQNPRLMRQEEYDTVEVIRTSRE